MILFKIFFVLFLIVYCSAYKIGIFIPGISASQIIFNQRIGDILSDAGHNVTFINLEMFGIKKNVKLSPKPGSEVWNTDAKSDKINYEKLWDDHAELAFSDDSFIEMFLYRRKHMAQISGNLKQACERLVSNTEFIERLKAAKFDVVFAHMADFCPIGLQYVIKAPTWQVMQLVRLLTLKTFSVA
uniref:glucuronosyltransferase n=1 Tax=Panagrolaimus davidi TaxID=227884 RepID=A0A914Q3N6_9BILA